MRFVILALISLGGGSLYLTRICVAVANTTIQREMQIDERQMGFVFAAFTTGYFIFQIPGGWLGNVFGIRRVLPSLSILWSLITVWTSFVGAFVPLLCSRFAFGLAQSGVMPITAETIREWAPESRRGWNSAVFGASLSIGSVVAMGLTGWLIDFMHWRTIFRVYSLVGIGWAVAFYFIYRNKPEQHPYVNESELKLIRSKSVEDAGKAEESSITEATPAVEHTQHVAQRMLRSKALWALSGQSLFRAAGASLFVSWFPAYLEIRFGLTPAQAGQFAMVPPVGIILGGLTGGVIVDQLYQRTRSKWISRSGFSVVVFLASAACLMSAAWASNSTIFVVLMSASAFCSGMGAPPAWAATIDIAGLHTSKIMGTVNMIGTLGDLLTTVLMGFVIKFIRDGGGEWNLVVYIVLAIYLACAFCWLAVDPNQSIDDSPPSKRAV